MSDPAKVVVATLFLTFFLDLLDLAFARIVGFIFTLRFSLYFILHCFISGLACYLLHGTVPQWYLLSIAGTFLGVGVLSNSDVKIGGANLLPIATLFKDIKAKMVEQAGDDKAKEILDKQEIAELTGRIRKLPKGEVRGYTSDALTGARWKNKKIQSKLQEAAGSGDEVRALADLILRNNFDFAKKNIEKWEQPARDANASALTQNASKPEKTGVEKKD
jgi:hypothetical protein